MGLLCAGQLFAEEITSSVIHDYSQVGIVYRYVHDFGNTDDNAHGFAGNGSYEIRNFVLSVSGDYLWGDNDLGVDADVNLWSVVGGVGYVLRLYQNHVNIIPRFEVGYSEVSVKVPGFGTFHSDSTAVLPGITLSYAINNRISFDGGYTYAHDLDTGDDGHGFTAGTRIAVAERIGLNIQAMFAEGLGFTGVTAGLSFHY